ncbi:MAG: protein-L-isoaspartate(D-aspartate) O-methyltransferase [Planctomycetota bacterium]|nr:MAG: protein-L-isoaspartate(D-aspartate) O-methyltransferase [Planctomycetota bacterium]REK37166.1 MAG: protein-L-isoaspartate(D-aspartate) O-methyltransferase [Planctomycetota bacterium]
MPLTPRTFHWLICPVVCLCFVAAVTPSASGQARDPFRIARMRLVDEDLAPEGITNERVLEAMRSVPRHLYVRPALRHMAYFDQALDIGHKQTISPPFIVAYMTQVLDPQPDDKVLEIGTGSGYQASVLSGLVDEVYTIEIIPQLGRNAQRLLRQLNYDNVQVKIGDGYEGWPEHAPFDKIIVTCSPEDVPQPLVEQLKDGGRMIIPLGERYQQVFHLLEKKDGELVETELLPTLFVPMTGKSEDERDVLPDPGNPQLVNGDFEELRGDEMAVGWHYQRRSTVESDGAPSGSRYLRFINSDPGRSAHILQGLAIDGSKVPSVKISLSLRVEGVRRGTNAQEEPSLVIHFFDQRRRPIGQKVMGPWLADSSSWQHVSETVSVPAAAREAIVQVGLNGSTGTLSIDDVKLMRGR